VDCYLIYLESFVLNDRIRLTLTMDPGSVYGALSADAFSAADLQRQSLSDDFLNQFLASKVNDNKKKEIEENLNSYSPFNDDDNRRIFRRKPLQTGVKMTKRLTAKEKRVSQMYVVPKHQQFSNFFTLHLLWEKYMIQLLEMDSIGVDSDSQPDKDFQDAKRDEKSASLPPEGVSASGGKMSDHQEKMWLKQLQSADYHGALVTVIKASNKGDEGKTGIIIAETKNTFSVATPKNKVSLIPKQHCVFAFEIRGYVFTIYGNNIRQRSAARSGKKFKSKGTNPMMILDL